MALFILAAFVLLTILGTPIGFVLGLTAIFGFLKLDDPVFFTMLPQRFFSAMDSFAFLALPFFLLAGDIMNKVGLTGRLVDFSNVFFGRLRGGLAQVNIVTSIIFALMHWGAVAWHALPPLFVLSLAFGWIYERTGRLSASIVMHILFNAVNVALAGLAPLAA